MIICNFNKLVEPSSFVMNRGVVLRGKYRESTESASYKLHLFKNA